MFERTKELVQKLTSESPGRRFQRVNEDYRDRMGRGARVMLLAVAGFLYAIYRFVWRHLRPLPVPEVHEQGPSIDDVPVEVNPTPVAVRSRKRRAR